MEKTIPNLEALKKFLDEESKRNLSPLSLSMTPAMRRHMEVIERFKNYILVPAWPELNLPSGAQIAVREKDDDTVAPYIIVLQDMTQAFQRSDIRKARRTLMEEQYTFDHLVLTDDEWEALVELENANLDKIPAPFYHEALDSFMIQDEKNAIFPFRRSQLPRIKYNGYDILPLVDTLMDNESGQTLLFCIGLANSEADNIYQVALFWFGNVSQRYHSNVVGLIYGYFHAQYAFHVCPERVIEVKPDDPDPFAPNKEPTPRSESSSSRKPGRATIARTIYIRDYPQPTSGRIINRKCRCWYVHGFMRTYRKTGKQVWIKGYFKGPDRDNPSARQHTKDYVMT